MHCIKSTLNCFQFSKQRGICKKLSNAKWAFPSTSLPITQKAHFVFFIVSWPCTKYIQRYIFIFLREIFCIMRKSELYHDKHFLRFIEMKVPQEVLYLQSWGTFRAFPSLYVTLEGVKFVGCFPQGGPKSWGSHGENIELFCDTFNLKHSSFHVLKKFHNPLEIDLQHLTY